MYPDRSILFIRLAACLKKMFMLVLLFRRKSAADMALRLVDVQNHPGLGRQGGIDVGEAVGDIFMFRRDELERFRPSPNLRANAGKYPHSHPYPLRFSG